MIEKQYWFEITKEQYNCLLPVYKKQKKLLYRNTRMGDFYYFVGTDDEYLFAKQRFECLNW